MDFEHRCKHVSRVGWALASLGASLDVGIGYPPSLLDREWKKWKAGETTVWPVSGYLHIHARKRYE